MAVINPNNYERFLVDHPRVLPALTRSIFNFEDPQYQRHAVVAMVNIIRNYPRHTLPVLRETMRNLRETHASSLEMLEDRLRDWWIIPWLQTRINKSKILLIQFRSELVTYINYPDPLVRWAAINAIGQLSAALDPDLRLYIRDLALAICDDLDPDVRLAAIDAIGQLFTDLGPGLQLQYHRLVLRGLAEAIYDFQYPQVQDHAATAMINFSVNYPQVNLTPRMLQIVRTLLEELASSRERLELALEDIASEENQIRACESLLRKFGTELPHDKWVLILAGLAPNQEAEYLELMGLNMAIVM